MLNRTFCLVVASILIAWAVVFSPRPASADTVVFVFNAQLSAANEVPPVTDADSGGTGTAKVTLTVVRDASGTITSATAQFDVSISGLAATSKLILSHIHQGAAGTNGPVVVDSGLTPASPLTLTGGAITFTRTALTVSPTTAQAIISGPSGFYFNSHTDLSPGGAVRGQLTLGASPTGPVIQNVQVDGKNLDIMGTGFTRPAVVVVNGVDVRTKNLGGSVSTFLIAKKLARQLAVGQTVTIQVRNADGTLSNTIMFTM